MFIRLWRAGFRLSRRPRHLDLRRGPERICVFCLDGVLQADTWETAKPGSLTIADLEHLRAVRRETLLRVGADG